MRTLLTPNEVAVLADTSKRVVEKAVEQNVLAPPRSARSKRRKATPAATSIKLSRPTLMTTLVAIFINVLALTSPDGGARHKAPAVPVLS
jgi:hypothetical protein